MSSQTTQTEKIFQTDLIKCFVHVWFDYDGLMGSKTGHFTEIKVLIKFVKRSF